MSLTPAWLYWPELQTLVKAFESGRLRFVGGAVRNTIMEWPVHEVDAATSHTPQQTMEILEHAGIRAIPTGLAHGTVTAVIGKRAIEITSLRKDIATDGRHAKVAFTDDWQEDAARRDFTMNALYLSPGGQLFDYFSGADDARAGRVCFIGKAEDRIREDYLRILRFFRFYAWYGKNGADASALAACQALASGLSSLSGERIQQEMFKLLAAPSASKTLALMHGAVSEKTFGGAIDLARLERLERIEESPNPIVRLAALVIGTGNTLTKSWRLSNAQAEQLRVLTTQSDLLTPTLSILLQKQAIRRFGASTFKRMVLLAWSSHVEMETFRSAYQEMLALADTWTLPVFPVSGDDLKSLGFSEGKDLGDALRRLENVWENSDYALSKEHLLRAIKRL